MKLGISAKVIHNPRLQFVETFTGEFLYDLSNEYPEVVENLKMSEDMHR